MPVPPYPEAQEVSKRLLQSLDHLLSNYKDEPEARKLLQLDGPPVTAPAKHMLMRQLFEIGQGIHDPSQVDEQLVLRQAIDMTNAAYDVANKIFGEKLPSQPNTTAGEPKPKPNFDFLNHLLE